MKKILLALLVINPVLMAMDSDDEVARITREYEQELRYRGLKKKDKEERPPSREMTRSSSPRIYLSEPLPLDKDVDCESVFCCIMSGCCTCGIVPLIHMIEKCAKWKEKF